MNILKSFRQQTSEVEFLKSLSQKEQFITPFLLSCSSRNAKFSSVAIQSLNKLISTKAIPVSRINDLLDAFVESTHLAVDIQLKVLQTLPALFQNYGTYINDQLVAKALLICSMLQSPSKIPMVINTSAATQQQIILVLFDKVLIEDKNENMKKVHTLDLDGESISVGPFAYDAYRVLLDMCSLTEGFKASFLKSNILQDSFGFELIENIFTNYSQLFLLHEELAHLVRVKVTPLLLRAFSSNKDFSTIVRVSRIILLLIRTQLKILEIEAEVILSLLTHIITRDSNSVQWKKILALEIFKGLFSDFALVIEIFQTYDNVTDKKKIINDFLTVCSEVINETWSKKLLNINDIVFVPKPEFSLTSLNSCPKIQYIDSLDKAEAPSVPKTYILFLILSCSNQFSEGAGNYVLELSKNNLIDDSNNNNQVNQIKSLLIQSAKNLILIGSNFLYSSLGNELFHSLIRSLQKFCHSSGVLGLDAQRDSLLILLEVAAVSNDIKKDDQSRSIGETIVETLNSTINHTSPSNLNQGKIISRSVNARHIICFRALVSLTTSLGPTFGHGWRSVLLTLQWFDYYINGPSEFLHLKEFAEKPELSSNELKSIETSLTRLYNSTKSYHSDAYCALLNELIDLSYFTLTKKWNSDDKILSDSIVPCPFNKEYFLNILRRVSQVNTSRYLQLDNKDWDTVSRFLAAACTSQDVVPELRLQASNIFNTCIKDLAITAFTSETKVDDVNIENKLLFSLADTIEKMSSSFAKDQFTSAESQMLQVTLDTLYELLDRFGSFLSHSWDAVFQIINSPFKFAGLTKDINSRKHLLKSSFEIFQLILNDFLHAVPLNLIAKIIDLLQSFCVQTDDVNISFSAVSYYWLISDFIRDSILKMKEVDFKAKTNSDVLNMINDTSNHYVQLNGLWLYLLSSLVEVSEDTSPEISNGTLQTLFRIVESHGSYMHWDVTYEVVITNLLKLKLELPANKDVESLKMFDTTCTVYLKGIVELYKRYLSNISNPLYWTGLLECYSSLVSLNSTALILKTYESLNTLIQSMDSSLSGIRGLFFDFWSSQTVTYVTNDPDLYQMCLVELLKTFKILYASIDFDREMIEKSMAIFNNCVRYPFLPRLVHDVELPTKLQDTVLECMDTIDISKDSSIQSLVLLQTSSTIMLPFQTRSRIVKKLHGFQKIEIPSFIAVSVKSTEILSKKLAIIEDLKPQIADHCLKKLFRILLDILKVQVDGDEAHQKLILKSSLCEKSLSLLLDLSKKSSSLLHTDLATEESEESQIWNLIIDATVSCLPISNSTLDENLSFETFVSFKTLLLNNITQNSISESNLKQLISALWSSSFLYENDDLQQYLLDTYSSPSELTDALITSSFNNFSTQSIIPFSQQSMRTFCFESLFEFANLKQEKLQKYVLPFLICRLVLLLKKLVWCENLLNKGPLPSVQLKELLIGLNGLHQLLKNLDPSDTTDAPQFDRIYTLIIDNYISFSRIDQATSYLKLLTADFHKLQQK